MYDQLRRVTARIADEEDQLATVVDLRNSAETNFCCVAKDRPAGRVRIGMCVVWRVYYFALQ
jgi:hypothetical protein